MGADTFLLLKKECYHNCYNPNLVFLFLVCKVLQAKTLAVVVKT